MAQYTKHNSNYIKTVEHQHLKDGSTIFERDWVTIGSQLNFGPGKIPYYNDGNFIFTTSPTPFFQKRYKNGVTVATWTYDDIKEASSTVNQIQFDEYTEDIRSFVYYGSCVELLRATIEKIIYEFPGNIKVSDEELGVYKSVEEFVCEGENKEEKYVPLHDVGESDNEQTLWTLKNPFDINIFLQNVQLTKYDNPLRYLTYSWKDYLVSTGGEFNEITSYEVVMRQMYEKEAEPCDETVKVYENTVTIGNKTETKPLKLKAGNYFVILTDNQGEGQKVNNWENLCYQSTDRKYCTIDEDASEIVIKDVGGGVINVKVNGKTIYDKQWEEDAIMVFYREVKIPRTYKYYQMFSEEEYNNTFSQQGWVKSDCIMKFWLPDSVFLNRCDEFQRNVLYSEESNIGKNQAVYTVKINNDIIIEGYIYDGEVIPLVRNKDKNLVIQPKEEIIETYFNGLKGFEKQLLTRKTKPLYTNKFITPIEYNLGYLYYNRTYTWPSDGYCIDITSTKYIDFINKLSDMAELYDELWTDNLWRRMTHEAIKNYDWTYTREFIEGDEEDNVDGGERMHKVLNIIGRVFDDIKLSIDTIKRQNKTTYNGDRNVPNALLSDKLELFGWDIYSTIPTYKNENDETVSASEETITQEVLDTFRNENVNIINNWYPTSNPNKITFADVDVEFMRRLLLSTKRIFETKGTRQSIDMIMGLFGYGDTDYTITEHYRTVTPREYDEVIDQETNETLGDRIVRLNNQEKQMELLYDEDASGIPVASFIGGYDEQGNPKTYLIPYYDQTKMYDGNLYFQNKGGWFYKKDDESTEIDFSKWTETLSYLHVVSQVKDLMNVNPFEIKNGDIYYVANLNDYIDYTETTDTLYSHFFALKNELMPEEFSSWVNINLEDDFYEGNIDYTDEEASLYDSYAKKAKYLDTIIPYNIGNNPHVGYGEYDMGNEFFEYMKKPFKYALDKYYFTSPYYEEANDIKLEFDVSDRIDAQYDIENEDDNDKKIKRINNNDTYYLNDKVIIFKNNINNDEYKKYFKTVIINYLMQIIPSTAIFVLEKFALNGDKDEDDSDKFSVTFKFNNGSQRTVKIKGGASVNCPSNTKWNLQGGGNTIYEQGNGFPYIVNQDTTFIEYVIVYYTVRFYETEGGQITRTDSIEGGKTVNESGQWYRLGDANKTQVTFPYTVNSNVDFVKLVKFSIKWYDNADDTNPTTQQVTRGDNITALENGQRYYRKNDSTYAIVSFPIRAQQNEEFVKVTTYRVRWYQSEDDTNPEVQNNVIYGQSVTKSGQWCLKGTQTIIRLPYRITQNTDFVKYVEPTVYYTVRFLDSDGITVLDRQEIEEGQSVSLRTDLEQYSWYLSSDATQSEVNFPYSPINGPTDFIKVKEFNVNWYDADDTVEPPKFTVQFRLTETTEPMDTQEITAGEKVSLRGDCVNYTWYVMGDTEKKQVQFPYEVNNNITFIRIVSYTYVFESVSPTQTTIAYNVSHTDFVIKTTLNGQLHNFTATVTQGEDWLSVENVGSADAQNGTLTLKTTSYVNTDSQRTGTLRLVQDDSNKTITLQITQDAIPQTDGEITLRVKNSRTSGVPIESAQITFKIGGVDKVVGVGDGIPINGGERSTTFTINDSQKSQHIIADTVYIQPQMINANFTQSPNPYVYNGVGQEGAVELFIEILDEPEPITPSFELYPEFVPTHTDILYPRVPTGNTYSLPSSFYLMGNSNFFIRTKEVNTGEITITRSYNSIDYPYRIDDYGYGFIRAIYYDRWPGGQTTTYGSTVTFTPENDPTQAKTFKFLSEVDENNTEFQKGLLLSRLLRIPSSGLTGDIKMYFFPYSFDSSLFYDDIKCMVIDCSQVGDFDSNNNIIRYPTITGVEPTDLANNVFLEELLPTRVGATELNLHYKAGANNSADYKYAFVAIDISNTYCSYNNMTASRVHFIQEPYSANRVYYGDVPKDAKWWEAYADSSDRSQRYHYMFQFANSEILTGSREVTCASLKQNVAIQTVILVPTALPHTITSETGSYTELTSSEHYYWGNQEYTIYNLTTSNAVYTIQIL